MYERHAQEGLAAEEGFKSFCEAAAFLRRALPAEGLHSRKASRDQSFVWSSCQGPGVGSHGSPAPTGAPSPESSDLLLMLWSLPSLVVPVAARTRLLLR